MKNPEALAERARFGDEEDDPATVLHARVLHVYIKPNNLKDGQSNNLSSGVIPKTKELGCAGDRMIVNLTDNLQNVAGARERKNIKRNRKKSEEQVLR